MLTEEPSLSEWTRDEPKATLASRSVGVHELALLVEAPDLFADLFRDILSEQICRIVDDGLVAGAIRKIHDFSLNIAGERQHTQGPPHQLQGVFHPGRRSRHSRSGRPLYRS